MAKRKTAAERKVEEKAAYLEGREIRLKEKEADLAQREKDWGERLEVARKERDERKAELAEREQKVSQQERDAEAGAALRKVGRALIEGAFARGNRDGRQWPSDLAHMLFGHPGCRGY